MFLVVSALNVFNMKYEFNTVKSFPEDMPSRVGYEIVESKYNKGELAPSTVLLESGPALTKEQLDRFLEKLNEFGSMDSVRLSDLTEDGKAAKFSAVLAMDPYSTEAVDFVEELRGQSELILSELSIQGNVYYGGVTAKLVDERMKRYHASIEIQTVRGIGYKLEVVE